MSGASIYSGMNHKPHIFPRDDGTLSRIGELSLGSTSIDVRPMTAVSGVGYQSHIFGESV